MTNPDPWLTGPEQQAWRAYLQLTGTLTEHLDRALRADAGIPHTYYQVLAMLSEAPDHRLRMSELAAAAWASPSRMSHAIDRLQELGWVARTPAPDDRRGQIATLTEAGLAKLLEAAPGHAATVRAAMFTGVTDAELEAFEAICSRALAAIGQTCGEPSRATP